MKNLSELFWLAISTFGCVVSFMSQNIVMAGLFFVFVILSIVSLFK